MPRAREMAERLAQGTPLALAVIKEVAMQSRQMTLAQYYTSLRAGNWPAIKACLDSEDFQEGIAAFNTKRSTEWKGR